jgi:hypothetical protein
MELNYHGNAPIRPSSGAVGLVVSMTAAPRTITLIVSDQARPPLNKLVVPLSH